MEQMLSQMEDGKYNAYFNRSNNAELNKIIEEQFGAHVFMNNERAYVLSGNLKDVYEKLQEIQTLAQNRGLDKYFNSLSSSINSAKEQLEDYQDVYDAYVLQEKILSGENNYADYYKKAGDAYTKYKTIVENSGIDSTEATEAADKYAKIVSEAMQKAYENGDTGVVDYFRNLEPDLQAVVNSWNFKAKITPTFSNGEKNSSYDKNLNSDMKEALSHFSNADEILNFDKKANTDSEKKDAYEKLETIAARDFQTSMDALVDTAVEMYGLETQGQQDFLDRIHKENPKSSDERTKKYKEALENLHSEYKKISDWGLDDYADKIKDGSVQSQYGNVNMNNRNVIQYDESYIKEHADVLKTWADEVDKKGNVIKTKYDTIVEAIANGEQMIDTVYGGSDRFGENVDKKKKGWEVAFTPILPNGEFLSKDTVYDYIESLVEKAYANDGKVTDDELKKLDQKGMQIGNTFVHGIYAGVDNSLNYDNNGNWAELVGRLMHFSGKYGAPQLAQNDVDKYSSKKINVSDSLLSDWYGKLSDDDKEIANSQEFVRQLEKQQKQLGNTAQTADDLDAALKALKDTSNVKLSFIDMLNTSDYADVRKELVELAKSGEISAGTLSSTSDYNELLEKVGISAEDAKDQIIDMLSAQDRLAGATQGLDKLKSAYEEFKDEDIGFVTAETLQSLPDVFKNLPEFDLFSKIVGNPESGSKKIQQAFNDIVKAYILDQETLQGLVDADQSTIQTYIANLKQMGISNAEEVVRTASEVLSSDNKMIDAAEKEYNKYLKTKNKADLKYIETTASNNGKLKNALGSAYESDYNNWCDLLSKKAEAYNKFVEALGGSYDESKSVMDNLMANGSNMSIWDITNAYTAKSEYDKQVKEYKKMTDSLKLDLSSITTDFSTNWTPSTKADKKSKSKTKSDAKEVFDFIAIYLDKITDKASKAKDKIDDLLTFGQKKNQTKKAIEATTKAIAAQEKAYKRYMDYANKQAKKQNAKKTTSTSSSSSSATTTKSGGNALYDEATKYLGLKYVWGGASLTSGADCSGFTQQIYKKFGVSLPHHAADQQKMGTKITSQKDLQPGDLVFFGSKNNIKHVGIYGGDGKFIESPHTGASVRISKLSSRKDFVSGSRFSKINDSTVTTTTSGKNVKKVKGVSSKTLEHYKKLIRNGTLDSDGIQAISNENLKNALQDYQTWYEKAKACKDQIESLKDQLKDLYETLANNPIDKAASKIEKLGTKIELISSKIANKVVRPNKSSTANALRNLGNQEIKQYTAELKSSKDAAHTANVNFRDSKKDATKAFNKIKSKDLKGLGLTQKQLDLVKKNLKSGKAIPQTLIDKMKNTELIEKCLAYNEYLTAKKTAMSDYKQAKEDYVSNKAQAAQDTFDRIATGYENSLSTYEYKASMAQSKLDAAEKTGHVANQKYYNDLIDITKNQIDYNAREAEELIKTRDAMVKSGAIKKYDDTWYSMSNSIWQCKENVEELTNSVYDYQNALRDLKWEAFTTQEEYINRIPSESEFISSLIDSKDKYDENGNITKYGKTVQGLHAMNANVYQMSALDYEAEIRKLDNDYKNDSLNNDYLKHRQELLESQREAIKNVESERQAIVSLVKDGYDAMKDALDELIQKRKDALQSEKDLFDYQKSIAQKSQNIAKLRKQLLAYSTDTSEETKAKIQKLKVSIDDAQQDLKDTEYDKWISDQEELMDNLLSNFQEWIDKRLKDTDSIIKEVVNQTNTSAGEISDTLKQAVGMYGTTLSSEMSRIWDVSSSNINESILSGNGSLSEIGVNTDGTKKVVSDMWTDWENGAWLNNESTSTYKAIDGVKDFVSKIYGEPKTDYSNILTSILEAIGNLNQKNDSIWEQLKNGGLRDYVNGFLKTYPDATNNRTHTPTNSSNSSSFTDVKKISDAMSSLATSLVGLPTIKHTTSSSSNSSSNLSPSSLSSKGISELKEKVKKSGHSTGGELTKLVKLSGEDGILFANEGEGILSEANMNIIRDAIKMSYATLSMADNNWTKIPQLKPISNDLTQSINIGDIQVVANNPQEFAEELRKAISSDVKTQKMFTALVGNQMMGKNSLDFKKYK